MKIKNLSFNKEKLLKYAEIGLTLVVLGEGSWILANKIGENREETYFNRTNDIIQNEINEHNENEYSIPAGFVARNGKLYKVVEEIVEIDAIKLINREDGSEYYTAPAGFVLRGNKAVKKVIHVIDDSLDNNKRLIK